MLSDANLPVGTDVNIRTVMIGKSGGAVLTESNKKEPQIWKLATGFNSHRGCKIRGKGGVRPTDQSVAKQSSSLIAGANGRTLLLAYSIQEPTKGLFCYDET